MGLSFKTHPIFFLLFPDLPHRNLTNISIKKMNICFKMNELKNNFSHESPANNKVALW